RNVARKHASRRVRHGAPSTKPPGPAPRRLPVARGRARADSQLMRIAIVSRSSRRVGGVEDYLSMVMPAMHRAGSDMAFWHEVDTPSDRDRIEVPPGTPDICAAEVGLEASIQQLREWKPHALYVQGIQNV